MPRTFRSVMLLPYRHGSEIVATFLNGNVMTGQEIAQLFHFVGSGRLSIGSLK